MPKNDGNETPRVGVEDDVSNRQPDWVATIRAWPTWAKVVSGVAAGVLALSVIGAVGGADEADEPIAADRDRSTTTAEITTTTIRRTTTTAPTTTTVPPTTAPPTTAPPTTTPPAPPTTAAPAPQAVPAPDPEPAPEPEVSSSGPFENCTAARAAGAAPVYRGDAGYGDHLDRDGDGVGCE